MRRQLLLPVLILALATVTAESQNWPAGRQQVLQRPFEAGVTHVAGRYGFTEGNFLVEGANAARQLGATSIFIYMTPNFRSAYPDRGPAQWPDQSPASLVQLAQTQPYQTVFKMPFRTIVISAFSFANADRVKQFASDPNAAVTEEKEFYDLTKYLYATFAGSGKTFILKHWEGDWVGLEGFDTAADVSPTMIDAMTKWLLARQSGVSRARVEAQKSSGVAVLNAVEVNRVLDYAEKGLRRVINKVVPAVQPDMVAYSSYDSSLRGSDSSSEATAINTALDVIRSLTPDPLGLGNRRILISEYGLYENERPTETIWRAQTILDTAKTGGLVGAFHWEVFDNECSDVAHNYFPVASDSNDPIRPLDSQCRGLWLVRPAGSDSSVVSLLAPYWSDSTAPAPPPAASTGVTVLSPLDGATVPTKARIVASAKSSYPITTSKIYVDDVEVFSNPGSGVDAYINLAPGWHRVVAQAWDSTGAVFKKLVNVNATNMALSGLVPVLTVTPKSGLAPLAVTASTAQSLGSGLVSKINFGDGSASVSGPTATHTYGSLGNFRVTATVTDASGSSASTAATVSVVAPPPPPPSPGTAVTITSPGGGTVNSPVHVTAYTSSSASSVAMVLYVDGSPAFSIAGTNLDSYASMAAGTHELLVQAWGRPNAGDNLALLASARVWVTVSAPSGVTVSSPSDGGTYTSPVPFAASASSGTCAAGIGAMGIYTAPDQLAYAQNGNTLNTQLPLAPGTYNTVVQGWDKCGGAVKKALTITVKSSGGMTVFSPANNSTVASPVHFTASASTSTCAAGIASMGIYTAPGQLAYVKNGNSLDTQLPLAPGTYYTVVQAWDNCGGALKTPITVTVSGGSGVTVYSPLNNSTVTSPVRFTASASTSTCGAGIASMGIYTAPGQLAYVKNGNSLDTQLPLSSGTYSTVVQAWDNCGGALKTPITITVK